MVRVQPPGAVEVNVTVPDGTPEDANVMIAVTATSTVDSNVTNSTVLYATVEPPLIPCDIDRDGDVDIDDISLIFAARGSTAEPGDPQDFDADGYMTIGDGRA